FCLLSSVFCLLSSVFCLLSSVFCLIRYGELATDWLGYAEWCVLQDDANRVLAGEPSLGLAARRKVE
ncbi:hypothetical protein GBN25_03285, partial [Plesiomonas shigelloides]